MEKNFENKLKDHEVAPPASAWENIDKQLSGLKKPGLVGWRRLALLLLFPFMGLIGYGIYTLVQDQPAEVALTNDQGQNEVQTTDLQEPETPANVNGTDAEETHTESVAGADTKDAGSSTTNSGAGITTNNPTTSLPATGTVIGAANRQKNFTGNIFAINPGKLADISQSATKKAPFDITAYAAAQQKKFAKSGQFDPVEDKKQYSPWMQRITVAAIGTPESVFRQLSVYGVEAGMEENVDFRNSIESARLGSTYGLRFGYTLTPNITLNSGLFVSKKGERIAGGNYPSYFTPASDTAYRVYKILHNPGLSGSQPGTQQNGDYISVDNSYTYLSVPVEMQYSLLQRKRLRGYASAGAGFNYLVSARATIIEMQVRGNNSTSANIINRLNKLDVQLQGSIGLEYTLTKQTSLLVEPVYKRSIISMLPSYYKMQHYHRSLGVNFGVKWRPFSE